MAPSRAQREAINRIIFTELVNGIVTRDSTLTLQAIISDLAEAGCDAVALVCTELPILIPPHESPLPTLDSTRLLARAALQVAVGDRPLPRWTGGPL